MNMTLTPTNDPNTPPDIFERRKRKGWKPDRQGRLLFRPRGLYGGAYVVETAEQLDRIEKFERTKAILMVVLIGAVVGTMLPSRASPNIGAIIGGIVVVLAVFVALIGYSLAGGSRIARDTAMRKRR